MLDFKKYINTMAAPNSKDYDYKVDFDADKLRYRQESDRLFDEFKADLFTELDITNNPKAQMLFMSACNIAWAKSHSYECIDVYNEAFDLVQLIK